jgi:hypothetical protein
MKRKRDATPVELQISSLLGDPASMEELEIEAAFDELRGPADIIQQTIDIAEDAAKTYRVSGRPVPDHLQAALKALKGTVDLERAPQSVLTNIVETALAPFCGPVERVAYSYRELTKKNEKDREVLESLADEVKGDWGKEGGSDDEGHWE